MTPDQQRDAKQFFAKHPTGQALKKIWEARVGTMVNRLIYETDEREKNLLQAKIQYHKEILLPEIGL